MITRRRLVNGIRKGMLRLPGGTALYRMAATGKAAYTCPICGYHGPFADEYPETGVLRHHLCPGCGAHVRHRLQYLVAMRLREAGPLNGGAFLHFAPDRALAPRFREWASHYTTSDLNPHGVDVACDICDLPFDDAAFDVVYASHVLEHIPDDAQALREIRRVLKPGGLAVLPVPILGDTTVEYDAPNPYEADHVRAPGMDYPERYRSVFRSVEVFTSDDFDSATYQLHIYEDRTGWPATMPQRPIVPGERHCDVVPVCTA